MDRYAVMGNPIAHSKSPRIHGLFAKQTGQAMTYAALRVAEEDFDSAVTTFFAEHGKGLNITVPLKQHAWRRADHHSTRAARAEAVNTLRLDAHGALFGDNTDGVGLLRDLQDNHGLAVAGARVLLLGAGGAARGVLEPLLSQQPRALRIANRTAAKAVALADQFSDLGAVEGGGFEVAHLQPFDLIVNATAASLQGDMPPLPPQALAPGGACYDMMYAAEPTPFLRWALELGATAALDGLGMLVEQAAESFWLWRGIRPQTAPVIDILRAELAQTRRA